VDIRLRRPLMSKLMVEDGTHIQAPAERIWKILTDSAYIQQYMFGCVAESDWKPGSPLLWKGAADGHLYVKGRVVAIEPWSRLEYTVIGADMKLADVPENYLTITCKIEDRRDGTANLNLSMGDFDAVGEGKKRYEETVAGGGWAPMLKKIKELAEEK
jgi:uncharacterized protein YndB with AHSA1/START domain